MTENEREIQRCERAFAALDTFLRNLAPMAPGITPEPAPPPAPPSPAVPSSLTPQRFLDAEPSTPDREFEDDLSTIEIEIESIHARARGTSGRPRKEEEPEDMAPDLCAAPGCRGKVVKRNHCLECLKKIGREERAKFRAKAKKVAA